MLAGRERVTLTAPSPGAEGHEQCRFSARGNWGRSRWRSCSHRVIGVPLRPSRGAVLPVLVREVPALGLVLAPVPVPALALVSVRAEDRHVIPIGEGRPVGRDPVGQDRRWADGIGGAGGKAGMRGGVAGGGLPLTAGIGIPSRFIQCRCPASSRLRSSCPDFIIIVAIRPAITRRLRDAWCRGRWYRRCRVKR